jgi:hypothetical protein
MKGMLTPDQAPLVFTQVWESFPDKLSIPATGELLAAGDVCRRYLGAVSVAMYTEPPRTLIHNDVQGTTSWRPEWTQASASSTSEWP